MKPKVIFIVGPTASGKTAASIHLAQKMNGEVVSADSMAIYRGMDIGTAKPSKEEMQGIEHHMISCVDPRIPYSVSEYKDDAQKCIFDILNRDKMPIVCGGTGLYVNSLIFPLDFTAAPSDEGIRQELTEFAEKYGNEALHAELAKVDPETAKDLHPNNVRRVIRALEIYRLTGKTKSEQATLNKPFELSYEPILMGITLDRKKLYEKCDLRVNKMMEAGLLQEVKTLLASGLTPEMQSMQGIGYKELVKHINGELSVPEAIELMQKLTRHLAKRQLTWFHAISEIRWFDCTNAQDLPKIYDEMFEYSLGKE